MRTKITIVIGYDNPLASSDLSLLSKLQRIKQFDITLCYYLPKIPADWYVIPEVRKIEQNARLEASKALSSVAAALDHAEVRQVVLSGSSEVLYAMANKLKTELVITRDPEKLRPALLDRVVDRVKALRIWHQLGAGPIKAPITILTPSKFAKACQGHPAAAHKIKAVNAISFTNFDEAGDQPLSDNSHDFSLKLKDRSKQNKIAVNCW